MEDLAKKYSEILTKGEVMELFKLLEEEGSLSKTCRLVGIDRRTVYDWSKVKEIRRKTKEKVLRVGLSLKPIEVAEFLADKTIEKAVDIVARLLIHVYERAMKSKEKEDFQKYYDKFLQLKDKYDKPITESIKPEIEELLRNLETRAGKWEIYTLETITPISFETKKPEYATAVFSSSATASSTEQHYAQ